MQEIIRHYNRGPVSLKQNSKPKKGKKYVMDIHKRSIKSTVSKVKSS